MSSVEYLDNQATYTVMFEAFVTFAVFGAYLGVFWILGEIPQLQFSLEAFLNQYGVVFLLGVLLVRTGNKAMNAAMRGM
jgi:hypothetical protein